ncbi:cyclodeaminase/cyclohydrolase family protein [Ammoniphilus sp. CFH 90114]|uniref:cyclodeaminase/cyclohydrolase family protein n=1 Tax=Ammoniphilus sp. CFH 90114 TaxID=2493665 RepID=UPI0013E9546F|nr:cyclodeaminase/cyclohydrolase family protein [Ammoniphilus sp. CFH 90114]
MRDSLFIHSIKEYIRLLSSSAPTPGGGSTSAVVASLGAAIALMAARISDRSEVEIELQIRIQSLLKHLDHFEALCQEDIQAFQEVMTALEKKEEKEQLQHRILQAAQVPFELARECLDTICLCGELLYRIKKNVLSDLGCAVLFLDAACQGALLTMSINLKYIKDSKQLQFYQGEVERLKKQSRVTCKDILKRVETQMENIRSKEK